MPTELASELPEKDLIGLEVRVYRNLARKCWSIQYKGRVVKHCNTVLLKDVRFKVLDSGYQRFLRENRKNVHAFVCGTLANLNSSTPGESGTEITYNPRVAKLFHTKEKSFKGREYFFDEHQTLDLAFCAEKTLFVFNKPEKIGIQENE